TILKGLTHGDMEQVGLLAILPYRHRSPLNTAARRYFDKLLAGNRAIEEKLAYYRQMTATAPRRYLKRFRLK
ncbi:hypothetical protein ACJ8PK_16115, partial [Serratia sp. CY81593]